MITVPKDALTRYACMDSIVTLTAANKLRKLLLKEENAKLLVTYLSKFVMPTTSMTLFNLERKGVLLDIKELERASISLQADIDKLHADALSLVPEAIRQRHDNNNQALSLTRDAFLRDILFADDGFHLPPQKTTPKGNKASVDKETLIKLLSSTRTPRTPKKFLSLYRDWAMYEVITSRYLPMFSRLVKHDGRLHPTYSISTTVTGRSSANSPSFQNLPRRGKVSSVVRRLIVAPEGYRLVAIDQSQSELRILASLSEDPVMMEVYQNDGDIHTTTAESILGRRKADVDPDEFKKARTDAKAVNFAFIYGGSATGFHPTS